VKGCLVQVRGLDSSQVSAVAMGEDKPVTKPENCIGSARTASLIVCLQPGRRVEIEVSRTR